MKENEIIPQQERLTNKAVKRSTSSSSSTYTTKIPASAWKVLAVLGSITTMTMYAETMLCVVFCSFEAVQAEQLLHMRISH